MESLSYSKKTTGLLINISSPFQVEGSNGELYSKRRLLLKTEDEDSIIKLFVFDDQVQGLSPRTEVTVYTDEIEHGGKMYTNVVAIV